MIAEEEGQKLVMLARNSINTFLTKQHLVIDEEVNSDEVNGVVVKLRRDGEVIGECAILGSVLPVTRLVVEASREAILKNEITDLNRVEVQVSLLSTPELIDVDPSKFSDEVILGEDGVLVKSKTSAGFMLASESGSLSFEEFINHACVKAGLDRDAWLNPNNKVFKFGEQRFQN